MAHFAELDENNVVLRVHVVNDLDTQDENGNELESIGIQFCEDTWGGRWLQTSYNCNIRKNYASIGSIYIEEDDVFISAKPYESWSYDSEIQDWNSPIPIPTLDIEENQKYLWDEDQQEWVLKTRPF
jgi:hypothetical protein